MKKGKRILAILLCMVLTACGKKEEAPEKGISVEAVKQIEHQVNVETEPVNVPDSGADNDENMSDSGTGEAITPNTGNSSDTGTTGNDSMNTGGTTGNTGVSDVKDGEYEETNDTVYVAVSKINLRTAPSLDSEVVGKAKYGDSFIRLAKGSNGWDKLLYDGQVVYAYAEYLTDKRLLSLYKQDTVKTLLAEAKKNSIL